MVRDIPEEQLQDNPEKYLFSLAGLDVTILSVENAGRLYGTRLAEKHRRSGATSSYAPSAKGKPLLFIKGFIRGYESNMKENR